jgi:hypothetical protein
MDHHRQLARPGLDEFNEPRDVLLAGMGVAVEWLGDVIHAEDQMVLDPDAGRPLHAVDDPQQRDDVTGAGLLDGVVQACERADVNHAMGSRIMPSYRNGVERRNTRR